MSDHQNVAVVEAAGEFDYYPLRISKVIRETADACSLVFEIPDQLGKLFSYKPGQYLTLQCQLDGEQLERCYSLSSSPDTDSECKVTVKAVADGRVSQWVNSQLVAGDIVDVMPPHGRFCLRENQADLLLFAAGSGITPCISILKTALAASDKQVRMLYANRDSSSVIFAQELQELGEQYSGRFTLQHNLDINNGFITPALVKSVAQQNPDADCFICGPGPFMDIVEGALAESGFDSHQVFLERFALDDPEQDDISHAMEEFEFPDSFTVILNEVPHEVPYFRGDTLLESARREGLSLPFSCRIGSCATCLATLVEGRVEMRINNVLSDDELKDGLILTCQGVPLSKRVTIKYV